jgi:hypothetical protein
MDLSVLTNAPRDFTIAGKTFTVSGIAMEEWGVLQAHLKDHTDDPVVAAFKNINKVRAAGVPVADEDRKALFEDAKAEAREWPPRVGGPLWFDLINTTDGAIEKFIGCVLRKHQPGLTDAEIAAVKKEATWDEMRLLVYRALSLDPNPKTQPLAAGGAETAAPAATSPTTGPGDSTPSPSATA